MNYLEFLLEEARRTSDTLEIIKKKMEMDRRSQDEIPGGQNVLNHQLKRRIDSMGFPNLEIQPPKPPLSAKVARLGVKILNVLLWFRNRGKK